MAIGGETFEARKISVVSPNGGGGAEAMEEERLPVVGADYGGGGGVTNQADAEQALARFAQAAASSPTVS